MSQTGNDNLIVDYLRKAGIEVTKNNYLSLAYPDTPPEERDSDMEDEWTEVRKGLKDA